MAAGWPRIAGWAGPSMPIAPPGPLASRGGAPARGRARGWPGGAAGGRGGGAGAGGAGGGAGGARAVAVLTGAGISTDSGIPDFRGPQGLWTKNPEAEMMATIQFYMGDPDLRRRSWR